MMTRIEQVRKDAEAVLSTRAAALDPLANGHLFITGGTGFLGTWLLELIAVLNAKHGFSLRTTVFSRSATDFAARHPHLGQCREFRFVNGDIRFLDELPRDTGFAIHAAALTDRRLFASHPTAVGEINAAGTVRFLRAVNMLENLQRFLLVSSGLVSGPQPRDLARIDEDYCGGFRSDDPNAIYAESKRFAEAMTMACVSETKLPVVIARPFAFVGPYQPLELPWAITDFMRDSLAGHPIKIMGDGSTIRSLLYASDFAYWTLAALARGRERKTYNIGSPHPVDLLTLATMITQHFPSPPEILTRIGQSGHGTTILVPSVARAQEELGVQVTVPLADAIQKTLLWHRTPEIF